MKGVAALSTILKGHKVAKFSDLFLLNLFLVSELEQALSMIWTARLVLSSCMEQITCRFLPYFEMKTKIRGFIFTNTGGIWIANI